MRIKLKDNWLFITEDGISKRVSIPHNFPLSEQSYPNPEYRRGIYKRTLKEIKNTSGKRVFLRFHGIDYHSKIFVNNKQVFEHINGYDLFDVEITEFLNFDGSDELIVEVSDYDITKHPERVAGGQDWYGNAAGIIQDVELWVVDKVHIKSVRVYPKEDLKSVDCFVAFSDEKEHEIEVTVLDPQDMVVLNRKFNKNKIEFEIPNPQLWSPETPNLYTVIINFRDESNEDSFKTRFGIRYVKIENGKLYLNGKPIYLFGALDQNFYPDTHYSLRDRVKMLSELTKAKDMGLNLLRFSVKIPDDLYLEIADELGILVWIDLPYARELDENSRDYLEYLLENVLRRHANHPSFVMMSLINESWGVKINENVDEETKNWLVSFYQKAKKVDPTRLYVDNSACIGNLHIVSDVNDYHFYNSFPYHNEIWKERIEKFASGEFRTFLEENNKNLPKIVSEFGVWGLQDPKLWEGDWPHYPVCIHGKVMEESSPNKHIHKILDYHQNLDDFIFQTQLQQFLGLKYQIETMRLHNEITGYVITEFSDISWESNGLLDYNRLPKYFYPYMKHLNSQILGIIKDHRALLIDPRYTAEIFVSNVSDEKVLADIIIRTEKRKLKTERLEIDSFSVASLGGVDFELKNGELSIIVEVYIGNRLVSRNFYPILLLRERSRNNRDIVWINDRKKLENINVIHEKDKILFALDWGALDWGGDWISSFTIVNAKRNMNVAAILWGLGEISSPYILLPQKVDKQKIDSVITRSVGWGYGVGSLLLVSEDNIFTTLRKAELSEMLIRNLLD